MDYTHGLAVLHDEAAAISLLADELDEAAFTDALQIIATHSPIIITGVGKSGHVASKVASTFTSLGSPAIFLHPTEASHGDMGLITENACIIAISYSGNSRELTDILHYCNMASIPIIGITTPGESLIVTHAAINLYLPVVKESCVLGKAPTTSTAMTLALGDALAVVSNKNVTPSQFKINHPGGKLGNDMLVASDLMNQTPPVVSISGTVLDVVYALNSTNFGLVCIMDGNSIYGVITDGDLRRNYGTSLPIRDICTTSIITTTPDISATHLFGILQTNNITSIPVIEHNILVGLFHIDECFKEGL